MRISDLNTLNRVLADPDKTYRSLPFWGWNDRLDPAELRRQMADMKRVGLGGCFSHSRDGLETPYLSEEWMEDTRVMADEGKKQDLEVWIYDEDKWPSGAAGGVVAAADPARFTAKGLTLELAPWTDEAPETGENCTVIGTWRADVDDATILSFGTGGSRITLRCERARKHEWYNGSAPSDNLNPDAVRKYIELTHEAYKKEFPDGLSRHVEGFFTDEPNCYDFFSFFTPGRPWIPWTEDFAAALRLGAATIPCRCCRICSLAARAANASATITGARSASCSASAI